MRHDICMAPAESLFCRCQAPEMTNALRSRHHGLLAGHPYGRLRHQHRMALCRYWRGAQVRLRHACGRRVLQHLSYGMQDREKPKRASRQSTHPRNHSADSFISTYVFGVQSTTTSAPSSRSSRLPGIWMPFADRCPGIGKRGEYPESLLCRDLHAPVGRDVRHARKLHVILKDQRFRDPFPDHAVAVDRYPCFAVRDQLHPSSSRSVQPAASTTVPSLSVPNMVRLFGLFVDAVGNHLLPDRQRRLPTRPGPASRNPQPATSRIRQE